MGLFDNIISSLENASKNIANRIKAPIDNACNKALGKVNPQRIINKAANEVTSKINPNKTKFRKKK